MGPGWIVSSNLEKDVNVIGNFVLEFNLITFTSGVHLILFSLLICNHLRADGICVIISGLIVFRARKSYKNSGSLSWVSTRVGVQGFLNVRGFPLLSR